MLSRLFYNEPDPVHLVVFDHRFQALRGEELLFEIKLLNILTVTAYKRDLGTSDLVCFEICVETGREPMVYTIDEEQKGFDDVDHLFHELPGYVIPWRERVILPVFEQRTTEIYRRLLNS